MTASTAEALLGEYSQRNIDRRKIQTLYMYAVGAQRQLISVCSHLGICESYAGLVRKQPHGSGSAIDDVATLPVALALLDGQGQNSDDMGSPEGSIEQGTVQQAASGSEKLAKRGGTLAELSLSCREDARAAAATNLMGIVYDNINMRFNVTEVSVGNKGYFILYYSVL